MMGSSTWSCSVWKRKLIWFVLAAIPLAALWPPSAIFEAQDVEWRYHLWITSYFGEYFRQHHAMPISLSTPLAIGMHYPVFYAPLFYPALALLACVFNPLWVLKGAAWLLLTAQLSLSGRAFRILFANGKGAGLLPYALAILCGWSAYPLTNLYNRGAIPEFFATGLVACALWIMVGALGRSTVSARDWAAYLFTCVVAIGTHAITALYSFPLLVLLGLLGIVRTPLFSRSFASLMICLVLALGAISPWLWALFQFQDKLALRAYDVWFDPAGIDRFWARFFPAPIDIRAMVHAVDSLTTPYLDAQFHMPMILTLLGGISILFFKKTALLRFGKAGWAIFAVLGATSLCAWMSLSPTPFSWLPPVFRYVQFGFRMITYVNLLGALAFFLFIRSVASASAGMQWLRSSEFKALLAFGLTLSTIGVVEKWIHARVVQVDLGPAWASPIIPRPVKDQIPNSLPSLFAVSSFATPGAFAPLSVDDVSQANWVAVPVQSGHEFGIPGIGNLFLKQAGWIATPVQAFPWNEISLDGIWVPMSQTRLVEGEKEGPSSSRMRMLSLAVRAEPGQHRIGYREVAPELWRRLRSLSFWILIGWAGYLGISSLWRLKCNEDWKTPV